MEFVYWNRARCVVICELARFPVHHTDWCTRVNTALRQMVRGLDGRIRLWRQRRAMYSRHSRVFDRYGVHVDHRHMNTYWNTVRYGVISGMDHQ